ncbi:hypothetical protein BU23DRAFT_575659 [Bimuria novae-zelandiae CBS 107.79]|uniref:Uncharacterized protein n=1 Tax=Bimuria novae-zelandiae CBS 107.79 TaxID=1447943 RepID=A0A6A5UJH4_9PLEO|nr:hypothetical protein BU23DRAFT_575659 [Bimuria novae-zelandiae CBS 107.79]
MWRVVLTCVIELRFRNAENADIWCKELDEYIGDPSREMYKGPAVTPGIRDDDGWGIFDSISKKKKGKNGRVASRNWDWAEPPAAPEPAPGPEPDIQHETRTLSRTLLWTQFNSRNFLKDSDIKALIL